MSFFFADVITILSRAILVVKKNGVWRSFTKMSVQKPFSVSFFSPGSYSNEVRTQKSTKYCPRIAHVLLLELFL